MVKPADPRKCDDLTDFSGFDGPLFWSVLILAQGVFDPHGSSQRTTGSRAEADVR